jgi:mannosyl-oligosaccharide glucosidase
MVKKDDGINQEFPWTYQKVVPTLKNRWGVNIQHNVEYWMMLDMLQDDHDPFHNHDGKEEKKVVMRVKDPKQVNVFFVPFFSSLSFNIYGCIMVGLEVKINKLL